MKSILHYFMLLIALMFGATVGAHEAFSPKELRAQCHREGRPCVGLVLSGGGARGFAHAGVIKVLEELGVRIDVVTGTSMGAMVGGAYAAGFTSKQLQETILDVNWDRMFAPRADRETLSWRTKTDDYKNLSNNALRFKGGQVVFPEEIIPSEELDLFLANKTEPVNRINDLGELAVPFAAVATDLVSGERVVLQKGVTLAQAMRASMSIPGAFAPVTIGRHLLVDGGLVDNLPVQLAKEMGAEVVIAVNVGTPLFKRDRLNSVVGVMAQMINLLTEQNVQRSLASLTKNDILIVPELGDLTSADLKQGREFIELGEQAARKQVSALKKLAIPHQKFVAWNEARTWVMSPEYRVDAHVFSEIKVEGLKVVNPQKVLSEAQLALDVPVSNKQIDQASRRIWADGDFSSVNYHFEPGPNGTEVLVFEPKEKYPGYSSIRVGGSLETDFDSTQTFNVILSHKWGWLNSWGAEWRSELQVGEYKSVMTQFYQPLGAGSHWFLMPQIQYEWDPYDIYENGVPTMRWRNERFSGMLSLGYEVGHKGYISLDTGYLCFRSNREIGATEPPAGTSSVAVGGWHVMLDTLDNVNFPTRGYFLNGTAYRMQHGTGDTNTTSMYLLEGTYPISWGPWVTKFSGKIGKNAQYGEFLLGGAFNLSGSPYGRWAGSRMQFGSVTVMRNLSDVLGATSQPLWVGGSLEVGRAWNKGGGQTDSESSDDAWRKAASLFVGLDSIVGPLYLVFGHTKDEGSAVYFFWGYRH